MSEAASGDRDGYTAEEPQLIAYLTGAVRERLNEEAGPFDEPELIEELASIVATHQPAGWDDEALATGDVASDYIDGLTGYQTGLDLADDAVEALVVAPFVDYLVASED